MLNRRHFLMSVALLATATVTAAKAATSATFDAAAFAAAQKSGASILIDVSAPWCPTCSAQRPILGELFAKPEYEGLKVFEVDFDSRKDVLRALGVRSQSTLIVYRGATEVGRSVGDTDAASISALLARSI